MKNIVIKLALIGLVGISASVFAQHGPPPSADQMVQHMTEVLGLSAEQQTAVRDLLEANSPKDAEREQRRAAVDTGLKAILTEAQYVEFEAPRKNRMDQSPPGHDHAGKPQR